MEYGSPKIAFNRTSERSRTIQMETMYIRRVFEIRHMRGHACCVSIRFYMCFTSQTPDQYWKEYDSRRGSEYSRFHGYTYDGIWTVALAVKHVARRIRHFHRNQTISDFRYRDVLWEKLFLDALRNTSFDGVTVSLARLAISRRNDAPSPLCAEHKPDNVIRHKTLSAKNERHYRTCLTVRVKSCSSSFLGRSSWISKMTKMSSYSSFSTSVLSLMNSFKQPLKRYCNSNSM